MVSELLVPNIQAVDLTASYGKFVLEPLDRGFGSTLGNALRRILLSSLPGYAVTAVRIEGVQHEYSTIPHMKEDIIEFLANVKSIRLQPVVQTDQPVILRLDWQGKGQVHAGDIERAGELDIVNPDLPLATLDDPKAQLSVEFHVERGKGHRAATNRGENDAIGLIPMDALFTPIRKANFEVERTRVGQIIDYDRLILEVWTDQTIGPQEAVRQAAQLLVDHFSFFATLGRPAVVVPERRALALPVSDELYNTPIEDLKLSSRTLNCLRRGSITTVGQVLERTQAELLALRNFGERSLQELYSSLQAIGIAVELEDGKEKHGGAPGDKTEPLTEGSPEGEEEQEDAEALRAYSAGAEGEDEEEEQKPEEVPPSVGRTFYPD